MFWCIFIAQQVNADESTTTKWYSGKTHQRNNLDLSLWNKSPAKNEWITLIVSTDEKYTWKITFPKLQYYSWEIKEWIDIPLTSKNFVSDYWDEATLWYTNLYSSDEWIKELPQFIKLSKSWYYRIHAEDEDWYNTYIEFKVSSKNTQISSGTQTNNTQTNWYTDWDDTNNTTEYTSDTTQTNKYISRSCKPYNIEYISSLNAYTSPDLNKKEYFINIDYFKRYVDSKNAQNAECYTERSRISSSYTDNENRNDRYIAPNWKIYFIHEQNWLYTSNELSSQKGFSTINELKEYIKIRNPLISMISYSKSIVTPREFWEQTKSTQNQTTTENKNSAKDEEILSDIRELLSD